MNARAIELVTGSRRGIGRAIAIELGRAGFNVALTDVQASKELDQAAAGVEQTGACALAGVPIWRISIRTGTPCSISVASRTITWPLVEQKQMRMLVPLLHGLHGRLAARC